MNHKRTATDELSDTYINTEKDLESFFNETRRNESKGMEALDQTTVTDNLKSITELENESGISSIRKDDSQLAKLDEECKSVIEVVEFNKQYNQNLQRYE